MAIYWLMFLTPLIPLCTPVSLAGRVKDLIWVAIGVFYVMLIGFRHEVGGDWDNYIAHYFSVETGGLESALKLRSLGYGLLNWLSATFSMGIYGVNVVAASLLVSGLIAFCRNQPEPWLGWAIATPYLLIVVAMGYSAQSVAVGLLLWGIIFLEKGRIFKFVLFVVLAATFHKTALAFLPLVVCRFFDGDLFPRNWLANKTLIGTLSILGLLASLGAVAYFRQDLFALFDYYIKRDQWKSSGASTRIWMTAIPGLLLLGFWRFWNRRFPSSSVWVLLSLGSLASVVLLEFSSTGADRMAIYLFPLQIYFWVRIPLLFDDGTLRSFVALGIYTIYGLSLWGWLSYADHAYLWLPYKNILLN